MASMIKKASLDFLKALSDNNAREWFNERKQYYLDAHQNIVDFADALLLEMNKHDTLETESGKKSLHRIYRDVRFSKDKTPYSTHLGGSFKRATKLRRGSYYFHIEPGNTFVAGGFWGPVSDDMQRIREDMHYNYKTWKDILSNKTFVKTFGVLRGEQLKSAPRGYQQDDEAIGLLRYKQFLLRHDFSDDDILKPDFVVKVDAVFQKMRPFLDHMSEVLTTDANGLSIV